MLSQVLMSITAALCFPALVLVKIIRSIAIDMSVSQMTCFVMFHVPSIDLIQRYLYKAMRGGTVAVHWNHLRTNNVPPKPGKHIHPLLPKLKTLS
jgi:hypothetical protein